MRWSGLSAGRSIIMRPWERGTASLAPADEGVRAPRETCSRDKSPQGTSYTSTSTVPSPLATVVPAAGAAPAWSV